MTSDPEIRTRQVNWSWRGQAIALGIDEAGEGPPVLLLPALSSISTRRELHPLMLGLAHRAHVIAPDWPGFGDQPKPPIVWTPDALSSFLEQFIRDECPSPHATIAAGHAASYALHLAAQTPGVLGRLALLAPTWRGPLPTMVGGDRAVFADIRRAIGLPVIGPLLYRVNINPVVVRMMISGHVYVDARNLTAGQIWQQRQVINASGARFGSASFVTGGLDRFRSRDEFLDAASKARRPLLAAYGAETPRKSRAEMGALASLPAVHSFVAPRGKLGFHEEFAEDLLPVLNQFLFPETAALCGDRESRHAPRVGP